MSGFRLIICVGVKERRRSGCSAEPESVFLLLNNIRFCLMVFASIAETLTSLKKKGKKANNTLKKHNFAHKSYRLQPGLQHNILEICFAKHVSPILTVSILKRERSLSSTLTELL